MMMNIAIILSNAQEVRLVHWAARIARARRQGLILFWAVQRRGSKTKRESTREGLALPAELKAICGDLCDDGFQWVRDGKDENDSESTREEATLPLELIALSSDQIQLEVEQEIDSLSIDCLLVPREPQQRRGTADAALHDHLLTHVPCEIVLLTAGSAESGKCQTIVTPVSEGPHSDSCLRFAHDIAKACQARLIALHVEPDVDVTAKQAATKILTVAVDRALGSEQEFVRKRVVLSDNVVEGIHETLDESPDLIVVGMKRTGLVRRYSSQGVADRLVNSNLGPAIAVVQTAMPMRSRVGRKLDTLLRDYVPQLPRDRRVSLVERIQRSSQWDFDFVMLICLSTLLAAGGLIQNSAAIVIGAMLVAPLMTPLLGAGLSLTQGNFVLFRSTLLTVLRGFLLAFVISFFVGLLAAESATGEMLARGSPRVLDILVAAVGGIAAAYASCRPNLVSALPGVAIAASLVPPIATAGIAVWMGEIGLAAGAALLFFTNIVAIILGTWIAFRAVGIRAAHKHGDFDRWTLLAGSALVLAVLILGLFESMPARGGSLAGTLQTRINALATAEQWECTRVEVSGLGTQRNVRIALDGGAAIPEERVQKISQLIQEEFAQPPKITFVTSPTQ